MTRSLRRPLRLRLPLRQRFHQRLPLHLPGLAAAGLLAVCAAVAAAAPTSAPTATPAPTEGPSLGAVFFTPAQRQAITQARRPAAALATATPASGEAAAPEALRFDGLVHSSQGLASAFVNGREVQVAHPATAARATAATPRLDGHAVRLAEGTRLVVGQTALPGAAPADLVPAGSVGRAQPANARVQPAVPADALQLRRSSGPTPSAPATTAAPAAPATALSR